MRPRRDLRFPGPGAWFALLGLAPLLLGVPAAAAGKNKIVDLFWIHPDSTRFALPSIALLPAVSFDNNLAHEHVVENALGLALQPKGYRWISPMLSKEVLRGSAVGEAGFKAIRQELLRKPRLDSLAAPRLCAALRAKAVMTVRIDLFERIEPDWNQAGKPTTTVQLKAALVDSTGRLLWTASGSETGEGPYHDPMAGTVGIEGSGLGNRPITGQGGAPSFEEVLSRLFARWIPQFPARVAAATAATAP